MVLLSFHSDKSNSIVDADREEDKEGQLYISLETGYEYYW